MDMSLVVLSSDLARSVIQAPGSTSTPGSDLRIRNYKMDPDSSWPVLGD